MSYLVLCILCQIVQRGDMKLKLPAFTEFAKTCPKTDKVRPCHTNSKAHRRLGDIVYTIAVQSKAIGLVVSVNKMHNVLALG